MEYKAEGPTRKADTLVTRDKNGDITGIEQVDDAQGWKAQQKAKRGMEEADYEVTFNCEVEDDDRMSGSDIEAEGYKKKGAVRRSELGEKKRGGLLL